MKILVTGAAGFIGGHLVRSLAASGHLVVGLDNRPIPDLPCEKILLGVQDGDALAALAKDCAGIYHLAAVASVLRSFEDPDGSFASNVAGTRAVFKAAQGASGGPIPVVYASSAAVYGDNDALPLKETATPQPLSPYAEHKLLNEKDAQIFGRDFGVPSFGIRFFNVYGPGQNLSSPYSGVVALFHDKLKTRQSITIFGDGRQTRDFVYIADAVDAMISGMKAASPSAPVANVCSGEAVALLELLKTLADVTGNDSAPRFEPARRGDIRHSCGDPSLCYERTGFKTKTTLKDGLAALN